MAYELLLFMGQFIPILSYRSDEEMVYTYWAYSLIGERANLNRCKKHQRNLSVCLLASCFFFSSIDSHFNCTQCLHCVSVLCAGPEKKKIAAIWFDWIGFGKLRVNPTKDITKRFRKCRQMCLGLFFRLALCTTMATNSSHSPSLRIFGGLAFIFIWFNGITSDYLLKTLPCNWTSNGITCACA